MKWVRIALLLLPFLVLVLIVASCTSMPIQTAPGTPPTTEPPTSTPTTPSTTTTTPVKSPPITIALDYFGIRNTHWIEQVGGSTNAQVGLIVILSDSTGTLMTWPPDPDSQTFPMDFFQVIPLKNYMGGTPVLYTGVVSGTLSLRVIANNVNKDAITKAQIDAIKLLGGGDLTALKAFAVIYFKRIIA